MMSKVLVVSVHPDDETLGVGGTILRHIANGDDVYWLVYTLVTRESSDDYLDKRKKLLKEVSMAYGFSDYFYLGFFSAELERYSFKELFTATADCFKRVVPDIVYTVGPSDVNTDHDVVYRVIMGCTRPSYFQIRSILAYEIPSSTNWAFGEKSSWFEPEKYVNISDYIDRKLEILTLFDDQVFDFPHARSTEAVRALNAYRGSSVGLRSAEVFKVLRQICF